MSDTIEVVEKPTDPGSKVGKDEIVCIVDRSGSMWSIQADAEGGLNSFIEKQKEVENGAFFSLVEFDDQIDTVCDRVDISEAPTYQLTPRNSTALLDAIGSVISDPLKYKAEGKTLVIVVADGGENASKEWTRDSIFALMELRKADGWEFMFLAANQDAIAVAQQYGFDKSSSMSFSANSRGVNGAYEGAVAYTTTMRTSTKKDALHAKQVVASAHADVLSEEGAVGDKVDSTETI